MVSPFDKNPFAHPDVHHSPKRKKTEGCASVTHLRGHPRGASTPALRRYRRHHHKARPSPIQISDCGFSAGRPSFGNPKTATDAQCDGDDDARVQTRGRRARRPHVVSHALGAHHNVGSLSKPLAHPGCPVGSGPPRTKDSTSPSPCKETPWASSNTSDLCHNHVRTRGSLRVGHD